MVKVVLSVHFSIWRCRIVMPVHRASHRGADELLVSRIGQWVTGGLSMRYMHSTVDGEAFIEVGYDMQSCLLLLWSSFSVGAAEVKK